jgi:ABC-type spermidine/putrescine transport system permease subunit I
MTFFKYFHYAYLVFAVLFLYDAFTNWGETQAYASLALGGLALFMFFFRGRFNKKLKK